MLPKGIEIGSKRTLLLQSTRVLSGVDIKKTVLLVEEPRPLALLAKKAVNRRERDTVTTRYH